MNNEDKPIPFIRELMNGKTEEEMQDAEDSFRRYLMIVKRIAERLEDQEGIEDKSS